ncbi:MAG: hypothetical protein AAF514_16705 [Verrucomicrobiota bacterium]
MKTLKQTENTAEDAFAPLRDVGCDEKTQCWDMEDIQAALRAAFVQGVQPERFFHNRVLTPTVPVILGDH